MNRAITGKGTKNRILLVMGACLPLLAIGCVAQVGSSPEDTTQSSTTQGGGLHIDPVKPPAVGDDPGAGGGGGQGDPQQPPPPPSPGGTTNPGDKNSDPVPSPWYGGSNSSK